MEKAKKRRMDFISSIVIVVFGIWMLAETFTFPMKDSWGGVQNVWFVSPALLPLFIGALIILLGLVLMVQSIKEGGLASLMNKSHGSILGTLDKNIRFITIIIIFSTYVYLYIPHIDFFVCTFLCLVVFITLFYLDDSKLMVSLAGLYIIESIIFYIMIKTGLKETLNAAIPFGIDYVAMMLAIIFIGYSAWKVSNHIELKKKLWLAVMISFLVPLILTPIFQYGLLVPLPTEGLIIDRMDVIRYDIEWKNMF
jgi:hypothetical protein